MFDIGYTVESSINHTTEQNCGENFPAAASEWRAKT